MKKINYFLNLMFVIIILLPSGGCSNANITTNDDIEIYQLLIHYVYLEDNSFGKPVDIAYLYILKDTDDGIGDSRITKQPSQRITDEVMSGISAKLSDLPLEVSWINGTNEVLNPSVSLTVEDGAIFTLGNIRYENGTKAYVSVSIYFAGLAASGRTYILENGEGVWKIIGDTGQGWVS